MNAITKWAQKQKQIFKNAKMKIANETKSFELICLC